ncbi:4166_t:CDS:1 [Racocetra fulgida]|uniref:4166_t:CDS:1 n=1 Tax=Racocetra fulgida TaxID=60492 RepID=A0A9N9NF10_9GLOM|nr:4166_t:CDS:1 [Racocetra fulgida]
MVKNNKQLNKSYQYPPRHGEILAKMRHSDHEGNFLLPADATPLEKIKYELCQKILTYKQDNNLTAEELAERISLSPPETKEILLSHIHKFTLDRLLTYASKLFSPFQVGIITAEPRYEKIASRK